MSDDMDIGERVAFYRKRRGMSQEVLAGLIGRTVDWLRKVEHSRIPLDRLSIIRLIAATLDVSLGDLIGEPALLDWTRDSGRRTVPALRAALMDHRQFLRDDTGTDDPTERRVLEREVAALWTDYQRSRYSRLSWRLPELVTATQDAARRYAPQSTERSRVQRAVALTHHLATTFLTKIGEADLASIAATRGLAAAQLADDDLIVGSLHRAVAHAMLSIGEYRQAVALTRAAADRMQPQLAKASSKYLSVYGTLVLVGAVASARCDDRDGTAEFLAEAQESARRLGGDANHLWTAFGPTNVSIHRVSTAMELGDVQIAVDLGPAIDTSGLPVERRVRHAIETARAFARWNKMDQALEGLLAAEDQAPEQVHYHRLSRGLVREMVRHPRPSSRVLELAVRMGIGRSRPEIARRRTSGNPA